jgi:hypothetical protein
MRLTRSASHIALFILLVSLPMAVCGCGFALVRGPPAGYQQVQQFSCTESDLGPILDVIAAAGGLVTIAVSQGDYYYYAQDEMIAGGAAAAAVYGASAVVGFLRTKRCRAARRQLEERLRSVGEVRPKNTERRTPNVERRTSNVECRTSNAERLKAGSRPLTAGR